MVPVRKPNVQHVSHVHCTRFETVGENGNYTNYTKYADFKKVNKARFPQFPKFPIFPEFPIKTQTRFNPRELAWRGGAVGQDTAVMKPISVTGILLTVLLASVLSLAGMAAWYVFSVRQYRQVQAELNAGEQNRARLRLLVAECMEYRKRNPAIDPVLQSVNLVRMQGTNAAVRSN